MAAALINFALEAPVLAAGIWSMGAIFYYGPTYIDKVGSWLHQNGTAPIRVPDPPINFDDVKNITEYITRPTHLPLSMVIKDANNFTEDTMGPTHPPLPPMTYKEKNVTKSTKNLMHSSASSASINNVPNSTNTITSVVPTPTGGSQTNDSILAFICDDQTVVGPFWCTLQALGFFSPVANFIYAIWLKAHYFFRFCAYHALLRPAINDYPIWRLLIITITVLGLVILPCHARRSLRHKWGTVSLGARLVFSGGCFLIMTYEHQAFYKPCNEDRCIVAAGLVLVPFLHWIVPQGAFTQQWNALCEDLLEIWQTVQLYAAGIWGIIAYPNRYGVGALGWVLLSTYWKEIIQMIENLGSAFNAIHTATGLSWDSAPNFLEAYNITESRCRIFQERTSVYGVSVLRLFALSMIPSVYYYLLHFARCKIMLPKSFACFLPFGAIIVAGWHGFDPLDLASVTVGALVDATMFYLGKRWTALGHFHLAFCYLHHWLVDLAIVPLLKAAGRLFLTIAMGSWKLARRHRFVFGTLCSVFLTGAIGNVVLFGWSWWKFGPLGTKHYFDTVSSSLEHGAALYTAIVLFAWSWISSTLSSLIRPFVSILSSSKDYVKSYSWPTFNISAWIPAPNLNDIYDDLCNRTNGSVTYLPSRSTNCVNDIWDFVTLVARGISTTISMGSKSLLNFSSKHVNNFHGFVARSFDNMVGWTAESWTRNQETFNNVCRFLVWVGVLFGAWNSRRWLKGDSGGDIVNGSPGPGPPGVPPGPPQNLPGPPSSPAGPPISSPSPQGTPLPPPDNGDGGIGNSLQPPPSGGGEDRGNDGGGDENDPPSPASPLSGDGDGGDDHIEAPTPSPRSFLLSRIVPPQLSPLSSPDLSPLPFRGSSQLTPHSPLTLSSPPEVSGLPNPPIVGLAPSEQATELRRLARAKEGRLAEIERRNVAVLAQSLHDYHLHNAAAATIKQTYRTYRSNKTLKLWKTTVSSLVQERKRVTTAARRESERLRKEEEDRAAEIARLETKRLRQEEEDRAAEVARLDAERLRQEEENRIEKSARLEAERLRKAEEERIEAERVVAARVEAERLEAERNELARVEAAHIERQERDFKQVQGGVDELARLDRDRAVGLDKLKRKRLALEERARRENERIAAEQQAHINQLAREREDSAEKVRKERERLRDVEKKRREKLAEIELQNTANKKTNPVTAKERAEARAEWMRKRREEKAAALAAKDKKVDGKDAQRKRDEEEAAQKKREEEDQLRQAKEKKTTDDLKQFGTQKVLKNTEAQVHNAFVNGFQVDKARKHKEYVAHMNALQKEKKQRIRKLQEKNSVAHQKAHEDDEASNNAPTQPPANSIEDATITTHTPGTMAASGRHGSDLGADNDDDNDDGKTSPSGSLSRPSDDKKRPNDKKLQNSLDVNDHPPLSSEKPSTGINSKNSLRDRLLGGGSVLSRIRRSQGQASRTDQTGDNDGTPGPSTGGDLSPPRKDEDGSNDYKNRANNSKGNENESEDNHDGANEYGGDDAKPGDGGAVVGIPGSLTTDPGFQPSTTVLPLGQTNPPTKFDRSDLLPAEQLFPESGDESGDIEMGMDDEGNAEKGSDEDPMDQTGRGSTDRQSGNGQPQPTAQPAVQSTGNIGWGGTNIAVTTGTVNQLTPFGHAVDAGAIAPTLQQPHHPGVEVGESPPDFTMGEDPPGFEIREGHSNTNVDCTGSGTGPDILAGTDEDDCMDDIATSTGESGLTINTRVGQAFSGSVSGFKETSFLNFGQSMSGSEPLGQTSLSHHAVGISGPNVSTGGTPVPLSTGFDSGYAPAPTQTSSIFGMAILGGKESGPLPSMIGTTRPGFGAGYMSPVGSDTGYQNSIDTSALSASQQSPSRRANINVGTADGSYAPKYSHYMPKTTPHTTGTPSTAARFRVSPKAPHYSPHAPAIARTNPITVPAAAYEQELAKTREIPGHEMCIGNSTNTKPDPLRTSHAHVQPKGWEPPKAWSPSSPREYDSRPPARSPSTRPAQTSSRVSNLRPDSRPPQTWSPPSPHVYNRESPSPGPGSVLLNGPFSTVQSGHGPSSATGSRPSNISKYREVEKILKEDFEQQKARTSALLESSPPHESLPPLSSTSSVAHTTAPPEYPETAEQRRVRREAKARENSRHNILDDPNEHWGEEDWQSGNDEIIAELEKDESESSPMEECTAMEARTKKIKEDAAVTKTTHREQQVGKADGDAEKKQQEGEKLTGEDKMKEEVIIMSDDAMSDDSDLSSVNSIDSEARREIEIDIIRNKRCDQN